MFGHNAHSVPASSLPMYNCYRDNVTPESQTSSPAARPIPSGRKGSKKVRTGCVTCKIRKVKCDETKPFCQRCHKTGRKCDGYREPRVLTKRRSMKDISPCDQVLGSLLESAAPEEKRAFWFFHHCTAPCISGDFDAVFWRVVVLQTCQTEPALRHAVLAVSSLHESLGGAWPFPNGSIARPQQSLQYNRAITHFTEQMKNPHTKPLVSLLTCILFVCIEYMQGKDKESLIHLEQGRQLLTQLDRRSSDPEMECIVRHVVPLYTRLSLTSFLFGASPVSAPDAHQLENRVPTTFDSADDIRHSMREFMKQAFRFTQRARLAKNPNDSIARETMGLLEVEQDRLLARLAKLNVALSLFRATFNPGPEDQLLVLRMHLHAQHIWISTALSSSEVVYDDFLSSFAAIVPLASAYLDLDSSAQHHRRGAASSQSSQYFAVPDQPSVAHADDFTFEMRILPPLYYVATKCRHPLIRRSALDLLRRNPFRRVNLWRASVMGALAGHIVSLEERWSQGQSPNHLHPHKSSQDIGLYSSSMEVDQSLAAIPGTAAMSASIPSLSVEALIDPSVFLDVELSSSFSHPPSLATSADEGHSSSSLIEPKVAFLSLPSSRETWHWQQQQQHRFQQHNAYPASQMSYTACSSYDTVQAMGHDIVDYSSPSGSSEISSVDLEEQRRFRTISRGHSPLPQYQPPQHAYQQSPCTAREASAATAQSYRHHSPVPSNLVMEAPFGLPEELRVHDAIVGPEREEGTWVAVFRKLHGVDADWDVRDD